MVINIPIFERARTMLRGASTHTIYIEKYYNFKKTKQLLSLIIVLKTFDFQIILQMYKTIKIPDI